MKLYLSGVITTNPNYKNDFENAYKRLNDAGYTVVSPVIFCDESMNFDRRTKKCIQVLSTCTAVAVIDTPYSSMLSDLELEIATTLFMQVKTVDEWIAYAERQKKKQGLCRRSKRRA